MKNISLETFLKLINKYGATAVLSAWLFMNNIRINKLENQLYDCYQTHSLNTNNTSESFLKIHQLVCVIPEKQKIISHEYY